MSSTGYAAGLAPERARTLFGRVMGLVALTVGCATLGVYLAREMGGADWSSRGLWRSDAWSD